MGKKSYGVRNPNNRLKAQVLPQHFFLQVLVKHKNKSIFIFMRPLGTAFVSSSFLNVGFGNSVNFCLIKYS